MVNFIAFPVIHLDIKAANVVVSNLDVNSDVRVKLIDFGTSRVYTGKLTRRLVDNPLYLAPEILTGEPYGLPADVYGFAMVFLSIQLTL